MSRFCVPNFQDCLSNIPGAASRCWARIVEAGAADLALGAAAVDYLAGPTAVDLASGAAAVDLATRHAVVDLASGAAAVDLATCHAVVD